MAKIDGQNQIMAGSVISADLAATGVTAATYGSGTQIPVITVNPQGQILGVTLSSISGGAIGGSGTAGQLALFGTSSSLTSSPNVTYDSVNSIFVVGQPSTTPAKQTMLLYGGQTAAGNQTPTLDIRGGYGQNNSLTRWFDPDSYSQIDVTHDAQLQLNHYNNTNNIHISISAAGSVGAANGGVCWPVYGIVYLNDVNYNTGGNNIGVHGHIKSTAGTGYISQVFGMSGGIEIAGGGINYDNVCGIQAAIGMYGTHSHSPYNAFLLWANNTNELTNWSGNMTNMYGLYIDPIFGATNNYAIYTNAGPIRFGGGVTTFGYQVLQQVTSPINVTVTAAVAGTGFTYAYRVSAVSGTGETLASTEVTVTTGSAVSATNPVTVKFRLVSGADSYRVYGRTAGAELYLGTGRVTSGYWGVLFLDTGTITPAGALPTSNTTGYTTLANGLSVPLGKTVLAAATTGLATLNLPTSATVNPATPVSGDLWWNGTNLNFYNGAITKDLLAAGGSGSVTGVTATAPVVSSGGAAPVISMPAATTSINGYLASTDWAVFSAKAPTASPAFTGTPTAPTPLVSAPTYQVSVPPASPSQLATIDFVQSALYHGGAGLNLTGGGLITFSNTGVLSWGARFIVISRGRGTFSSISGYYDILMPTTGAITGVGGASARNWTTAGIQLGQWDALYYVLPVGTNSGSVATNFVIASYQADFAAPPNWVLLGVLNGDSGQLRLGIGVTLNPGNTWTNSYNSVGQVTATAPLASSGGSAPVISLTTIGTAGGPFTNATVTTDAFGRVTAVSTGTAPVTSVGVTAPITTTGGLTPTIGLTTVTVPFGGTGQTTLTANAVLLGNGTSAVTATPTAATGYLYYNGSAFVWQSPAVGGGGTVTSVALAAPSIFSVAGSPVTSAGTLTLALATQTANTVFAGPNTGIATAPAFRTLVAADLPTTGTAGGPFTNATVTVDAYGRVTTASTGAAPVTSVGVTSPIATTGGTAPTLSLTTIPVTLGGTGQTTLTANSLLLGNGASGIGSTPTAATGYLYYNGAAFVWQTPAVGGGGTVTSVGLTAPSIFSVTGSPVTSAGALALALATQSAGLIFASPITGAAAAPTFRAIAPTDLAASPATGNLLTYSATGLQWAAPPAAGGTGTVTSVGLSLPSIFTISNSPVVSSGVLTAALASQTANLHFASPNGVAGAPTFRAIVAADLPAVGTAGGPFTNATVTVDGIGRVTAVSAGVAPVTSVGVTSPITTSGGVTPTLGLATVTVPFGGTGQTTLTANAVLLGNGTAALTTTPAAAAGYLYYNGTSFVWQTPAVGGGGTVTNVALTMPSIFTVSGSPVTSSGTLATTLNTQTSGLVLASPITGAAATPTFRSLTPTDLAAAPATGNILTYNGAGFQWSPPPATGGTGTVTSVGLSLPSIFSVSGSPVSSSGVLAAVFATQVANTFFTGPGSGVAAIPTFRVLTSADLPTVGTASGPITNATVTTDAFGRVTTVSAGTAPVTSVGVTSPITTTGGVTPTIGLATVPVTSGGTGQTTLTSNGVLLGNGTAAIGSTSTAATGYLYYNGTSFVWQTPAVGGGGTVTSVGLTAPSIFSVTGSPVTSSGSLALALTAQAAGLIFASPITGAAATPAFRTIAPTDLAAAPATGNILTYNGAGFQWSPPPATGGTGTVNSVGLSLPAIFSVSGSPVTSSGVLTATLVSQAANLFLASPNGSVGAPSLRAIASADLPAYGSAGGPYTNATVSVDAYGRVTASTGTSNPYNGGATPGAVTVTVVTVTAATYAPVAADYSIYCNTASNTITVTLPTAASSIGRRLEILKTGAANTVVIQVSGGGNINTQPTQTLYGVGDTVSLESDGATWWVK